MLQPYIPLDKKGGLTYNLSGYSGHLSQRIWRIGMHKYCVILCALLLFGCSAIKEVRQQDSFERAVKAYRQNLLMGKYRTANAFRKPPASAQQAPDFTELKKIRITSYELTAVNISQDLLTVNQTVEIGYYNIDSMVEKILTDNQLWKYDPDEKAWHLHSDFPEFQ